MTTRTVLIQGTGLLGASIGMSLRSQGWRVLGSDPDEDALDEALRRGAIESKLDASADADADLIVLAAPPDAIVGSLADMKTDSMVTDIAGVKMPVVAAAGHLSHFVGGHPMAGGETSGAAMASSSLFHGATWVLTSDGAEHEDIMRMDSIVRSMGANPVVMTAGEHDSAVARVSHLPHVLAAALVQLIGAGGPTLDLAGGGFRDMTRVAAADSGWWAEVLAANADQVGASIAELRDLLESWAHTVSRQELSAIQAQLDEARRIRSRLGEHHAQVRVILLDRPGEIARIGHALESSRVDVRDFQLRHGEHGGGGILTISVKPGGHQALTETLIDEGFELQGDGA